MEDCSNVSLLDLQPQFLHSSNVNYISWRDKCTHSSEEEKKKKKKNLWVLHKCSPTSSLFPLENCHASLSILIILGEKIFWAPQLPFYFQTPGTSSFYYCLEVSRMNKKSVKQSNGSAKVELVLKFRYGIEIDNYKTQEEQAFIFISK